MDIHALELATRAMDPASPDALFFRLTNRWGCGAWRDTKPILVDREDDLKQTPVRGAEQLALELAGGRVNFNLPFLPEEVRAAALSLEQRGVLERCAFGDPARPFRVYTNHYVPTVKWAVTGRCNYRCKHCFLSAPEARFGELPTEDCLRIIRQMAQAGIQEVTLTGGEPLVRQDLFLLLDEIQKQGLKLKAIATNGALVNELLLDRLEERGLRPSFFMSFDGVGWHDWLRGIEGAEKMLMGKFELLAGRGFYTGSAFTMHKRNAGVLRQTVNRLAEVGVQQFIVNRMISFGEWRKYGQDFNITQREVFETYLEYLPHFFEDGMPVNLILNRMLRLYRGSYDYTITAIDRGGSCDRIVCPATRQFVFITGNGKVAPCIPIAGMAAQEEHFADLSQMSLAQALEDSPYSACYMRTAAEYFAKNPECAVCEYRRFCMGGCRAEALEFDETDYLGVERHRCEFFREHFADRILQRLADTVPQARCVNLPADFPRTGSDSFPEDFSRQTV